MFARNRKAIIGALATAVGAFVAVGLDGDIPQAEWLSAAALALTTLAAVWITPPNAEKKTGAE